MRRNFSDAFFGWLFILALALSGAGQNHNLKTPPTSKEITTLEPGLMIEREISAGQKHFYKIRLAAGQYARLEALQNNCDVVFSMISPEGFNLLEFKNVAENSGGTETAVAAVEQPGEYEFRVSAYHGKNGTGSYQLKIAELRAASEKEISFTAGMRLTDEGFKLTRENATTGDLRAGMEKFLRAAEKLRLGGSPKREGVVLRNVGDLYNRLGNRTRSIEYAQMALESFRRADWKYGEFKIWQDMGETYLDHGEPVKALECLFKASAILQEFDNKGETANTLNFFGKTYERLGERRRAAGYYEQALKLAKEDEAPNMEIDASNNLGRIHWKLGDNEKARSYFQSALVLARSTKLLTRQASVLNNLARLHLGLGETDKALATLDESLQIFRQLGDRLGEAAALKNLGQVYLSLDRIPEATASLDQSLAIYRSIEDAQNLAETLLFSARAETAKGSLETAQAKTEEAISLIEKIRARVTIADLRDSFSANLQDFYSFYIELLMRRHTLQPDHGFARLAFQASERARARGLINLLAESNANIREGVEAKLLKRETELENLLSARLANLTKVLNGKAKAEETARLKTEVEQIRAEYEQAQALIRQNSPRYSSLTQPETLDLEKIQTAVLDADSVLLEYALGEKNSYLWVVTRNSFQAIELPAKAEIENAARRFYDSVTARNRQIKFETAAEREERISRADSDLKNHSAELSRMVLAPAAGFLSDKRLLVVTDGALQYIPFASLVTGDAQKAGARFLIENNEVVNLPSASALAVLRRETAARPLAPKTLAIFADPIFDKEDERFKTIGGRNRSNPENKTEFVAAAKNRTREGVEDLDIREGLELPRLPYTRREAETISSFVPAARQAKLLDFEANRRSAMSPELSGYRYVHFATHGFINNENPELSGIVLSLFNEDGKEQDGFLRVGDIYNLKMPAEIVVLSGCKTGLGKEIKGEGLVGMTRGFMYAGAKRVAVSLWSVNDQATAELMANFYREMLGGKKLAPAAALRQAQIRMLKDARWQNPYFWSTFIIQGEPR